MLGAKTAGVILLWWFTNGLTSIYTKTEISSNGGRSFFKMKWIDLTIMQLFFGALGSAFWTIFIAKKAINVQKNFDRNLFVAVLANLIGHLSVNVSYSFVSSSATQVVKSTEPVFMFIFLVCCRFQNLAQQKVDSFVLLSIFLMVLGTFLFVLWDMTFNIWGIIAAVVSNIAFPLRNIALKKMSQQHQSATQKYFVLSFLGTILLLPLLVFTFIFNNVLNITQAGILAGAFHCTYNLASISVLQKVSPLNHTILNFSKRIFVILLNIKYFNLIVTWHMIMGLIVIFTGLATYHYIQKSQTDVSQNFVNIPLRAFRKHFRFFLVFSFLTMLPFFLYFGKIRERTPHHKFSSFNVQATAISDRKISTILTTSWIFTKPMANSFRKHILEAHLNTGASVVVYCGTEECMDCVANLKEPKITAIFLVVPKLLKETPLKEWGDRHVLYKILAGLRYEWYLSHAVCLAHLWKNGGSFYLPSNVKNLRFSNGSLSTAPSHYQYESYPCLVTETIGKEHAELPPKSAIVMQKMAEFVEIMNIANLKDLPPIFQDTIWNAYTRNCRGKHYWCKIKNRKSLRDLYERDGIEFAEEYHFGSLSFDQNVGAKNLANIGDEIQGFSGLQFLPFLDFFLDRDGLISPDTKGKHLMFFNAWWGKRSRKWPPPENIDPVMVSVHTETRFRRVISSSSEAIDFLKAKAPIGARDVITQRFMESLGVNSFFSGCMTLFIKNFQSTYNRNEMIYIADLSKQNRDLLPEWVVKKATFLNHNFNYGGGLRLYTRERYLDAYKVLEKYSLARVVLTQRIHAALPCVAMGTPVIFFNSANMPGGGGNNMSSSDRVKGLVDLFHTIDLYKLTLEEAKDRLKHFNWNNPPTNPNLGTRMRMVASMWYIMRQNKNVHDSARRFGMLPITPEYLTGQGHGYVFHVIHDYSNHDQVTNSGLSWHQWRCVESILRYHPTSKLLVHSNSINQSLFDVLTEVGFHITVKPYKVSKLVLSTPVETFFNKDEASATKLLKEGMLPLLLLYKYGGVYLADDTVVLKPIDFGKSNELNVDFNENVVSWVLKFEQKHEFIREVLEKFSLLSTLKGKSDDEQVLLTQVWNEWRSKPEKTKSIGLAKTSSFYSLNDRIGEQQEMELGKLLSNDEVQVIRITNANQYLKKTDDKSLQLEQGTIIKDIFNKHCLLCSNKY